MKLHEISVKKPVAVTMAVLMFVVIGLYSLTMLPIEMTPEIEMNMAIIATQYPNVGSEEVENLVTKTIEGAVASVSGVDSITSQSSEGVSMVMIQFNTGVNMDKAVTDIEGNIDMIEGFLPEDATDPMVLKINTDMMATAQFSVSYEGYDLVQTKQFVDETLESKLKSVNGVASVSVSGARNRQIDVYIDPTRLFGYNADINDVASAIMAQNQNMPSGSSVTMGKKLSARVLGKFDSIKDIENVPLMTSTGQVINLRDVAEVKDSYSDVTTVARLNGESAISVTISKESDANTVDVVNGVYEVLDKLTKENPKFTYNMTMEQGTMIEDSVKSVASNAISGAFLAVFVLLLFLGSVKSSLVIGIAMPISVITTFIGMYFSGMSLNVVSLGGLALGVGMLVDNAVVVLENIFRRRSLGDNPYKASVSGTGEVIGAVVASVLTTCIVYVPILFIDNMMAIMFKQLAFTIIFSQTASLLTTFLLIPMLTSRIESLKSRSKSLNKLLIPFNKFMDAFYKIYEKTLYYVLKKRKSFIFAVLIIFIFSMTGLFMLGMELMPSSDSGTVTVSVSLPEGTQLDVTDKLTKKIEEIIMENDAVATVFSQVGSGGMTSTVTGSSTANASTIYVTLKDARDRNLSDEDVATQIRNDLKDISGAVIEVSAQGMMASVSSNEISVNFTGNDDELLEKYVLDAEKILAKVPGIVETSTSVSETKYELHIKPNRTKSMMYGLTPVGEANLIDSIISGKTASRFTDGGSEYDIVVKYPDDYADTYEKLKNLKVKTPMGSWISISDISDISVEEGYSSLTRVDQKRVITLSGKIYNSDLGTVTSDFDDALKSLPMPDGISKQDAGTFEVMMDAMSQLLVAILLGILLMYMIMAAQFGSLIQPFIILGSLPLSMIGVTLSLFLTGSKLSAISCIGILMLTGIVVNNAIVLIEFINQSKNENPLRDRDELVVDAGLVRMRPILMTSFTSILGFLPMAMSGGGGTAMMQPLAIVLLGGLFVGTLLTLYVIPVLYCIVDDKVIQRKAKKLKRRENDYV